MLEQEKSFTQIYCVEIVKHLQQYTIYLSINTITGNVLQYYWKGNAYEIYTQFLHSYTIVYKFTHNYNMLLLKYIPLKKCEIRKIMPRFNHDLQTKFLKLLSAYSNMLKYIIYTKIVQEVTCMHIMTR